MFWSMAKGWYPGAVAFRGQDVAKLVRLLQLAPQSPQRDRLLHQINSSPTGLGKGPTTSVLVHVLNLAKELRLATLQHSASAIEPIFTQYYTLSRGALAWRYLSGHRPLVVQRLFIATRHRNGRLQRLRLDSAVAISKAKYELLRAATDSNIGCLFNEGVVVVEQTKRGLPNNNRPFCVQEGWGHIDPQPGWTFSDKGREGRSD